MNRDTTGDLFAPRPQPLGRQLAEAGAELAADHADDCTTDWSARALAFTRRYAATHATLTAEAVRRFAEDEHGFPRPPDGRAWGAVMLRAARARVIAKTDRVVTAEDPKVHANPVTLWRSLFCR